MKKTNLQEGKTMYCVIFGDIINSRKMDINSKTKLVEVAEKTFDFINTEFSKSIMAEFNLVRGDAFEGVMLNHYLAPKIIQKIIKSFYVVNGTALRISVVIGKLDIMSSNVNKTNGEAFYHAVDMIEKIKERNSNHWLQVDFDTNSVGQPIIDSLLELLSTLTGSWTDRQREAVWTMEDSIEQMNQNEEIVGYTEELSKWARLTEDDIDEIKRISSSLKHIIQRSADKLGISIAAFKKHLQGANYDVYKNAWENLEEYLCNIDELNVKVSKSTDSYTAYWSIGCRKYDQNNYEEALSLFKKTIELAKEELGEDSLQLVNIYARTANSQIYLGEYDDAEQTLEKALKIQEGLPKNRLEYARTIRTLGELKHYKKDFKKAEENFEEALSICRDTIGENSRSTLACYKHLALNYKAQGNFKKAIEFYERSFGSESVKEKLSPVGYAVSLIEAGDCYLSLGEKDKAIKKIRKAIKLYERYLPPKHPYIVKAENFLEELDLVSM